MAVFRVEKTKNFTVMSNHHLRNKKLSNKAKGLLSVMLSLPDNWDYTQKGLTRFCKDGEDSIATALKELEKEGYLTRQRIRLSNGRLGSVEYAIHELPKKPVSDDKPSARGKPEQDFPEQVIPKQNSPIQEKQAQQNKEERNTYKSNINQSNINQSHDATDMIDEASDYRKIIKKNINYSDLVNRYDVDRVDEIVEIMVDTVISKKPVCRIEGCDISRKLVRDRFLKIDSTHMDYIFSSLSATTKQINNIKAYLLTVLYNAPTTKEHFLRADINCEDYQRIMRSDEYS